MRHKRHKRPVTLRSSWKEMTAAIFTKMPMTPAMEIWAKKFYSIGAMDGVAALVSEQPMSGTELIAAATKLVNEARTMVVEADEEANNYKGVQ